MFEALDWMLTTVCGHIRNCVLHEVSITPHNGLALLQYCKAIFSRSERQTRAYHHPRT